MTAGEVVGPAARRFFDGQCLPGAGRRFPREAFPRRPRPEIKTSATGSRGRISDVITPILASPVRGYTLVNMLTGYALCRLMYKYILWKTARWSAGFLPSSTSRRERSSSGVRRFASSSCNIGKGVANVRFHTRRPTLRPCSGIISTLSEGAGRPSSSAARKIIPGSMFYNFHYLPPS